MDSKRCLALGAVLVLLLLSAIVATAVAAPPAPQVQLLASSEDGLTLEVVVPEPGQDRTAADSSGPAQITLEGYAAGPDGLPIRDLLVGLPPTGGVKVLVEPLAPTRIVPGPLPVVQVPRIVEEQEGLVQQAGWEPRPLPDSPRALPLAALVEEGFVREWRVARLQLAPMAYLGDGRWELTPHFRVQVTFDVPGTTAEPATPPALSVPVIETLINGEEAVAWRAAAPPLRAAAASPVPEVTWRIGITADGLYAMSYETLEAAGLPVADAWPADYHLLWRGQEVALQEVGMEDGALDPGDAFLFHGEKFHGSVQDEKYTDENVYWLEVDRGKPGLRMETRPVPPGAPASPATWYTDTVRVEEDNVYWARWDEAPGTDATWFWERLQASTPTTFHYAITLSDLSPTSYLATLRVEVAARNESFANPDHHIQLSVNGTPVGEDVWDGKVGRVVTLPIDATLLEEGPNDIGLTLQTDVGRQDIYFNWAEVTFRRQTIAQADQLALGAPFDGSADYTLTGFSSEDLHLYDLSDPLRPVGLSDAIVQPAASTWDLAFTDSGIAGQPYLAVASSAILDVPALTRYQPRMDLLATNLGADEIMITPEEFFTATQPLAELRRAEGLRVQVVRVEDIYPAFNGGIFHPRAIRDLLAYAYDRWQQPAPAYVLLVGDGHFNFKGHNPAVYGDPPPVRIPPYLHFLDPWQGEVGVDTKYAQIVGDDTLPDLAVGRINANSVQEVEEVVAKIIEYEGQDELASQDRLILVADNVPDTAGDFEAELDQLAADLVPAWMLVTKVYLGDYCSPPSQDPCPTATEALTQTWSQGAGMITYLGHGRVHRWADEPMLVNTQIDTLAPGHELPFVITLNCLDGYWMMPPKYPGYTNPRGMAEWMAMAADHGSIANFSSAGLGTTWANDQIARRMYSAIFEGGERRLGEVSLTGQLTPLPTLPHVPQVATLFGDPGGWLRLGVAPTAITLSSFDAESSTGPRVAVPLGALGLLGAMVAGAVVVVNRKGRGSSQ